MQGSDEKRRSPWYKLSVMKFVLIMGSLPVIALIIEIIEGLIYGFDSQRLQWIRLLLMSNVITLVGILLIMAIDRSPPHDRNE